MMTLPLLVSLAILITLILAMLTAAWRVQLTEDRLAGILPSKHSQRQLRSMLALWTRAFSSSCLAAVCASMATIIVMLLP